MKLENFDVVSSYHVISAPGGGTGDQVNIDGRVRLFHVWLTGSALGNRSVVFKNGSASGDVLLQFDFNFTAWPAPDNNNPIPGGGIVFDSGMHFDAQNASSDEVQTATFVYQLG